MAASYLVCSFWVMCEELSSLFKASLNVGTIDKTENKQL